MEIEQQVAAHYAKADLEAKLVASLADYGLDVARLKAADLAPVDEFHIGGLEASQALADQLTVEPGQRLLDVGSGIGGPARFFAERFGCRVTGIDLTPDFVVAATGLTARVGLAERVTFHQASALAMPFADGSFDHATLLHVGMNIADKSALMAEVGRVLRPGGSFAVYEVMRLKPGELTFPVPWASAPDASFLAGMEGYRQALSSAGFEIVAERERLAFAIDFFERLRAKLASGKAGPSLAPVMGETFQQKLANMRAGLTAGIIAPVEMIARKR